MKITKFTKEKGNVYSLDIEGYEKIKLYDETILKHNLLHHKEIEMEQLENIIKENNKLEAYYKSLKYLSKKLRTKKEIYEYLVKTYTRKTTEETIQRLEKENYFNDTIYLKSYINDSMLLSSKGPNKIKTELVALGFDLEDIKTELNKIKEETWKQRIEKIITKKLQKNHQYGKKRIKEKIQIELINLGYLKEDIIPILNNYHINIDTSLLMEKEYNRVIAKLSKKYQEETLKYQLKIKLLQKGFSYEEVDDFLSQKILNF